MKQQTQADKIFREYQIQKYNPKRLSPTVSMSIDIDASQLMDLRKKANENREMGRPITVTHVVLKAVSDIIMDFPILYSSFNGKKIVKNPELVLNLTVDFENHVEYLVIHNPDTKSLDEIVSECYNKLEKIKRGEGKFRKVIQSMGRITLFIRRLFMLIPGLDIKLLRTRHSNFVISDLESFGVDRGTLRIIQPMIAALCIGRMANRAIEDGNGGYKFVPILPLSIVFDHRPVDVGYVGAFLSSLKELLEAPDRLFELAK